MIKHWNSDNSLRIQGVIAINQEQRVNRGEDTSLCLSDQDSKAFLIACFDGCGGSGAKRYPIAEDWTGARIASHTCAEVAYEWYNNNQIARLGTQGAPVEQIATSLKGAFTDRLKWANEALSATESLIKGKLSKTLPTTMVAALAEPISEQTARCIFLWAGDSRGFLLSVQGLQQITTDDVQGNLDALENIQNDGVLTNLITANNEFTIRTKDLRLQEPCLIITATDGCFAYFISPIEFEEALLETLIASSSLEDWEKRLSLRIGEVASDDYTMQAAILGFHSFKELKSAFLPRLTDFRIRFSEPLRELKSTNDQNGMLKLWQEYKRFYS